MSNQAEALIHTTEKSLTEHGEKLEASDKEAIDSAVTALKEALEGEDTAALQAKIQALTVASMKLGEAVYKASQASGSGETGDEKAPPPPSGDDSHVVDADFEDVSQKE